MKENPFGCWADRPQVATVVNSLPADERREALTQAYREATTALKASRDRFTALEAQSNEIMQQMAAADTPTGKRRESLLERRSALDAERGLLPQLVRLQAEQLA